MKNKINYLMMSALLLAGTARAQYNFTTLPNLSGGYNPVAQGMDGNTVVGYYQNGGTHGFSYDISSGTYSTVDNPLGTQGNTAYGVSGGNIAGAYTDGTGSHGYLYNGTSYTSIDASGGVNGTYALGISGSTVVGDYLDSDNVYHGFSDNGTISAINAPGAGSGAYQGTVAYGISGTSIIGYFTDSSSFNHGFLDIGGTFTILNDPNAAVNSYGTFAFGISGNDIYGGYFDSSGIEHGYIYDISTAGYTTIDNPLGIDGSVALGGDGTNVLVDYYVDNSGIAQSSIASPVSAVPEPGILALTALNGLAFVVFRRNKLGNLLPFRQRK
jgi:hypothetical protein